MGHGRKDETDRSIFLNMNYCWIRVMRYTINPSFDALKSHRFKSQFRYDSDSSRSPTEILLHNKLINGSNTLLNARQR